MFSNSPFKLTIVFSERSISLTSVLSSKTTCRCSCDAFCANFRSFREDIARKIQAQSSRCQSLRKDFRQPWAATLITGIGTKASSAAACTSTTKCNSTTTKRSGSGGINGSSIWHNLGFLAKVIQVELILRKRIHIRLFDANGQHSRTRFASLGYVHLFRLWSAGIVARYWFD